MQDEWITTREAADLLGLSHNRAFAVLQEHECERREESAKLFKWRCADVLALRDLRRHARGLAEEPYKEPRGFAERLAERIRDYWAERGHDVNVSVVIGYVGSSRCRLIVSDLVNGLPTGWRGKGVQVRR